MTTRFLQSDVWPTITKLAKTAKRRHVAVAYLGTGATRLLPLKSGDTLVVDFQLDTVRAGQVNPAEISAYLRRGVDVYTHGNLHAKVFVFDNKAIIGSANVSKHSRDQLDEAAVLVTNKPVVDAARNFVASLCLEPVTPKYARDMRSEYVPPKTGGGANVRSRAPRDPHARLWFEGVILGEFDAKAYQVEKSGKPIARKAVVDKRKRTVYTFNERVSRPESMKKPGDLIIRLELDENDNIVVNPPGRVLLVTPYVGTDKDPMAMIFVETQRVPETRKWSTVRSFLWRNNVKGPSQYMSRLITKVSLKQKLLGLWSDKHGT